MPRRYECACDCDGIGDNYGVNGEGNSLAATVDVRGFGYRQVMDDTGDKLPQKVKKLMSSTDIVESGEYDLSKNFNLVHYILNLSNHEGKVDLGKCLFLFF